MTSRFCDFVSKFVSEFVRKFAGRQGRARLCSDRHGWKDTTKAAFVLDRVISTYPKSPKLTRPPLPVPPSHLWCFTIPVLIPSQRCRTNRADMVQKRMRQLKWGVHMRGNEDRVGSTPGTIGHSL